MKIFISGPMTNIENFNYAEFNRVAAIMRGMGFEVENPAENPEQASWIDYMRLALRQLLTCDAILQLDGWERSRGANVELGIATELDIERLFLVEKQETMEAADREIILPFWENKAGKRVEAAKIYDISLVEYSTMYRVSVDWYVAGGFRGPARLITRHRNYKDYKRKAFTEKLPVVGDYLVIDGEIEKLINQDSFENEYRAVDAANCLPSWWPSASQDTKWTKEDLRNIVSRAVEPLEFNVIKPGETDPAKFPGVDIDAAHNLEKAQPVGATRLDTTEDTTMSDQPTAPRVTAEDIEATIVSEHYFTALDGSTAASEEIRNVWHDDSDFESEKISLGLLTFCVLVLRNGFTVTGEIACVSRENFDAEKGRQIARENAVNKVWMLEGYLLKEKLAFVSVLGRP